MGLLLVWASPASAALSITVVRGDGGNNNPSAGRAASSVIRVQDAGKPVANSLVIFSAPATGPSFEFDGAGRSASAITDEAGTAVAPPGKPAGGNGPIEIRVVANRGGEFANTVIHQMNVGLDSDSNRATELDVSEVPQDGRAGRPGRAFRSVVRVQDGNGKPVKGATVVFTLRKLGNSGKAEKVAEAAAMTGDDGDTVGLLPRQSANGHLECMVEATSAGRRVTAFLGVH